LLLDGANKCHNDISGVLARKIVVLGVPVDLLLCDISLDILTMEEPVMVDGLSKRDWLLEDDSPRLDERNIVVHASAARNGFGKLPDDLAHILGRLDKV